VPFLFGARISVNGELVPAHAEQPVEKSVRVPYSRQPCARIMVTIRGPDTKLRRYLTAGLFL
jgi:hypothetical protein